MKCVYILYRFVSMFGVYINILIGAKGTISWKVNAPLTGHLDSITVPIRP